MISYIRANAGDLQLCSALEHVTVICAGPGDVVSFSVTRDANPSGRVVLKEIRDFVLSADVLNGLSGPPVPFQKMIQKCTHCEHDIVFVNAYCLVTHT